MFLYLLHHSSDYESINEKIKSKIPFKTIVGCSASGVIGEGKEFEYLPGISLSAGSLPNVDFPKPFHFTQNELPNPDQSPESWKEITNSDEENPKTIVLFPDPFSVRTEYVLDGLDFAYPNTKIIGCLRR